MKKSFTAMIAVLVFAGCATTGSKKVVVDEKALSALKPNVTTIAEVEAEFGQPFLESKQPNGDDQLQYVSKVRVPDNLTPSVGSNIPRTIEKTISSYLVFDQSGRFLHAWSGDKTVDENVPGNMGTPQAGDIGRGSMYSHGF
jgi:hypothetical protein